jgi:hypothetical protein
MMILVEITYEDGTVEKTSIQLKSGENNDTARKVYATESNQENSN